MAAWVPPALPVRDPAATLNFDDLKKYLGDLPTRLATIELNLAAARYVRGTDTVTFTASQFSAVKTVTHGLGVTPQAVILSPDTTSGAYMVTTYQNRGATTFTVTGWSPGVAITATIPFSWFATV